MFSKTILTWGGVFIFGLIGCSAPSMGVHWPEPRPLGKEVPIYHPPVEPFASPRALPDFEEPTGNVTLRQALSLALMRNPHLATFGWEVRAREARTLQAGLFQNPELEAEIENFGGSGDLQGTDGAETTIQLSQLIQLGEKRTKQARVSALERDLSAWDYETQRLNLFTEVTQAFVNVLVSQEQLRLTQEIVRLAEEVFRTVSSRVQAGKVSPLEETKARVVLAGNRIEQERADRSLEAARKSLAATWGGQFPVFDRVEGNLEAINPIPSFDVLAGRIPQNPDIARWDLALEQRKATVRLEEAKRIPDLTLGGGIRHFNDTDEQAFVLGLSIPLPLFNRNQGGVLEARYRFALGEEERRTTEIRVRRALATAYQALSTSFSEVTALREEVLPGAQSAYEAASEGYRQGKFGFLEVLDAQRTLFEAKGQYLKGLAAYHKAVADVERLIGEPLDHFKENQIIK